MKPTFNTMPIKNFTLSQKQERYTKGLCFYFDEKFHTSHCCQAKQFLLLLLDKEPSEGSPEYATSVQESNDLDPFTTLFETLY